MSFDRFNICAAYDALEADWNVGGWLPERPSNQRRGESIAVQLARIGYKSPYHDGTFDALDDEQKDIYINALIKFGLALEVEPDSSIAEWLLAYYVSRFVYSNFPQLRPLK